METPKDWLSGNPEAALKHIYDTNYPWLEKYILQNSGTQADAQDIFQESIVAAWVNIKEGRFSGSKEKFNAYIRQICKYKWLNQLKSAANRNLHYSDDIEAFDRLDEDESKLEEQLTQGRMLKNSFDLLGEKCRKVLRLYYYEKKSLSEIAAALDNTEESIKTIKYRCMVQLRQHFLAQNERDGQV